MLPAGGMYASADDLARWFAELFRLRRDHRALFDAFVAEGPFERYAAGIGVSERTLASGEKLPILDYSGEDPGYFALTYVAPSREVAVVLLSSTDYALVDADMSLGRDLFALALGEPFRVMK